MQFLSDLYVRCSECEGRRFQPHVLKVRCAGRNIHEVLELTVTEAADFLEANFGGSFPRFGRAPKATNGTAPVAQSGPAKRPHFGGCLAHA